MTSDVLIPLSLSQKTAVGAAAKKKAPLKAKKNAPNNSMSDADDASIVSDGDVDMAASDSDEEFGSKRARPAVQQAKGPQKTASEMYQKVGFLPFRKDATPLTPRN